MAEEKRKKGKKDRIGRSVHWLYVLFLLISIALVTRLVYIVVRFQPDPQIAGALAPRSIRVTYEPARGAILSRDGDILALTLPIYDVYMDCTVQKSTFAQKNGTDSLEAAWMAKASKLSEGLAAVLGERSAGDYYKLIREGRENNRKYVPICKKIERPVLNRLKSLPLWEEGPNKGGMIVERTFVRRYPYGTLARRTIGFVRNNKSTAGNRLVGLEGKYDHVLHGTQGVEYMRITDNGMRVRDNDSSYVKAVDGLDIRTTLDIGMQDIADRALREQIDTLDEIEGGCLVLMEVGTGAIRAMVNLLRDSTTRRLEETQNLAIGRRAEPGSVFKTVTLVSCLNDGYIKSLDETLPTNHGFIKDTKCKQDIHIPDWERAHGTREISILDGFKISSNYVFATLAVQNYARHPKQYIDNVYMYKLGEAFDFDIEGLRTPNIPNPKDPDWSNTTLGNVGFGYSTEETPLHILTFYNALANRGRMMKPFLVESIEKHGEVIEKRGPSILNSSICSKAVADTVKRALAAVTEEGTAKRLKNARCRVAGKTGTSFAVLENGQYQDAGGRRKYQGTFVGYFPVEDPQYSVICCIYSKLTHHHFQGGGIPATAVKTVVDGVYSMDSRWMSELEKTGSVPVADKAKTDIEWGVVPDLSGMGLREAVAAIESSGYKCSVRGTGKVGSQSLPAGKKVAAGNTIEIVLK